MSALKMQRLRLWCAATDRTFGLVEVEGVVALQGKCIHCNRRVLVCLDGRKMRRATVEHIVPRSHGGTDDLENLAIACGRCNAGKGARLDNRLWSDPTLQQVIEMLQSRRAERLRPPLEGLALPPLPRDPTSKGTPEGLEADEAQKPRRGRKGRRRKAMR